MLFTQRAAIAAVALTATLTATAADAVDYTPHIHGTVRPRFEWSTTTGDYRFQVRNARVALDGKVASWADYFVQTDLCDQGKMKILDAWARASFGSGVRLQAGQFRMPFGVDPFRAPNNYYFANRSFIGKQVANYRAVGAKISWQVAKSPLLLEAGAFNPTAIGDHTGWHNTLAYAARALATPGPWKFSAGVMSIRPAGVRANLYDLTAGWSDGRLTVEGEYMHEHYTHKRHRTTHAYAFFADYRIPVSWGPINRLSFQGRYDGMTNHSSLTPDSDGMLLTDNPARRRITVGSTITYWHSGSIYVDFRIDYEKYMYNHGLKATTSDGGDKLVAEVVLRF